MFLKKFKGILAGGNSGKGKEDHAFSELMESEPEIAQDCIFRFCLSAIGMIAAVSAGIVLRSPLSFLFIATASISFAAATAYRVYCLLYGGVSVYEGEVVRTAEPGLRGRETRARPLVVLKNADGKFIQFFPSGKNAYKEGDILAVYAHDSAFTAIDANTCCISTYIHVKILGYAGKQENGKKKAAG